MAIDSELTQRAARLTGLLTNLLSQMRKELDLETYHKIDDSFYMQKAAELQLMIDQIVEAEDRLNVLNERLADRYSVVFHQWQKDARWLNRKIHRSFSSKG